MQLSSKLLGLAFAIGASAALAQNLGPPGGGGSGGSPTGAAGGSLTGTYPNPGLNLGGTNTGALPAVNGGTGEAGTITGALKGNGTSPATQAACADLSNGGGACSQAYTSGTWTPTLIGSTSGSWVLSTHVGSYVQIGNMVTAFFDIVASSSSSPVGNMTIGGLPVASGNTVNDYGGCFIFDQVGMTNTTLYTAFTGLIGQASTSISLLEQGSGQATQVAAVARASSTPTLIGVCNYHT